jgi:phage repressor protein C with HTH and peptisase S24 domain
MMAGTDPRDILESLIRERGEDYASLSRLIDRNPAYIQQFIKRGTPRELHETDRRKLARYFGISEQLLGAPPADIAPVAESGGRAARRSAMITVPQLNISASAGPGAVPGEERVAGRLGFQAGWLRELASGSPDALSIISVTGDSMAPTLADGDDILVDRNDAGDRLRDGIYVLRADDALNVKRIALNPVGRGFTVRSDNPAYPDWPDCAPGSIEVIGRVVWAGRRIG